MARVTTEALDHHPLVPYFSIHLQNECRSAKSESTAFSVYLKILLYYGVCHPSYDIKLSLTYFYEKCLLFTVIESLPQEMVPKMTAAVSSSLLPCHET